MDLRGLVKEAALAAFVALIVAIPLAGFDLSQQGTANGAQIGFRPSWVAIAVVTVFVGRLVIGLLPRPQRRERPPVVSLFIARHQRVLGLTGLAIAIVWPYLPFSSDYLVDLATEVIIYMMLGWGLGVVVGLAGLLNLGYAAFYAVGAYTLALTSAYWAWGFWEALPLAGVTAAAVGILLALPVLRLRGDYLAIVTLGFGEIIRIILINWQSFTYGPNGINGVPRPTFFGLPLVARAPRGGETFAQFFHIDFSLSQRYIFLYFVTLALAIVVNLFILRLRRLPIGRAWEALREDEIASRALGINPVGVKLSAFAVGALLAGFAGVFFAARQSFVSPESFNFQESATVLAIVVLGGMGSQLGIALAAIILVTLPEFGRDFAQFRMLLFGAAMVGIMIWRPRGFFSLRTPSIRLGEDRPLVEVPK
ncbi:MAG TPA: high-affinity branched-chain amino acid ABC transporter permease LivM [Stellaceae bacterium]|nr:high-affinity branched-chain amino acid ABC transporter permease LivM [Stellaceae bacterium]